MTISSASAQLVPPPTNDEVTAFNQILAPLWKAFNLVKYVATALAAIFLLYAGITYMTSGNDMQSRDNAKNMVAYVVVGLIVIWAAPFIVQVFTL